MLRTLCALLICLPGLTFAACDGRDLRQEMSASEESRLDTILEGRPYPQGNHWRATRGEDVVHLVGTMHLDDPRFVPVIERLDALIATASLVLLEMTAAEEAQMTAAMAQDPELLVLPETSLPELMGDDWDALAQAMQARGMPPFMAAKFRPWYVAVLLSMPSCIELEDLSAGGLDARIEAAADAAMIPTRALEPFDTAFRSFAQMPLSLQVAMLRASLVPDRAANDLFATLSAAYFEEHHAQSWAISEALAERFNVIGTHEATAIFETMDTALLADRNRAWIPVILAALEDTDGHVIAAFGAAHLSGSDGVLALLEAEGFTLEQLPF